MGDMGTLLFIFASASVINNFTFSYFLGLCPFMGVTNKVRERRMKRDFYEVKL